MVKDIAIPSPGVSDAVAANTTGFAKLEVRDHG